MSYNLFLDDVRMPNQAGNYMHHSVKNLYRTEKWEIVRNYKEFVKIIGEKGPPKLVSFDHDLADIHYNPKTWKEGFEYTEETGLDCAKWLIQYCIDNKIEGEINYLVHSANPVGAENIKSYLESYNKTK